MFDDEFVESVKELVGILDPVAELTNYCQKSDVSAADAVEKWLELRENGPQELREYVDERCTKSNVFNDVTMTANYFHPKYRGKKLNAVQTKRVNDYIFDALDADALESVRLFADNSGTFGSLERKKLKSAHTFWYFADFATKYLKIPASTAQLERLFSNWAYIHCDTRNRLKPDTSEKLVKVYFTLRANDDPLDESDGTEMLDE